jgi:regulator of sigma E protease
MVLAFMNLLPIPALDGGHVMFLTFEMISGRKPSDKFLENAQKVGMLLLLALMVFVIFNDVFSIDAVKSLFGLD